MNLNEFKSWLDGFSEAIDGAPTKEQWDRVKSVLKSVHEITLAPVPNMTPSTWPHHPTPRIFPVSPSPFIDPYYTICTTTTGSAGDPPTSGCRGITNGEAKGVLPCH